MAEGRQTLIKASDHGIEQAKSAWLNAASQIIESQGLPASLATIHNFLEGELITQEEFQKICVALQLNWQEVAEQSPNRDPYPDLALNHHVTTADQGADHQNSNNGQTSAPYCPIPPLHTPSNHHPTPNPPQEQKPQKTARPFSKTPSNTSFNPLNSTPTLGITPEWSVSLRQHSCQYLQDTLGQLHLFNGNFLPIENLSFDIYLVQKISRNVYINFEDYLASFEQWQEFERFGIGERTERISMDEAIQKYSKLIVLGKSGSGKSTLLQYLVIQCCQKKLHPNLIPVFVPLSHLVQLQKPLHLYIQEHLQLTNPYQVEKLLNLGQLFILLDGADEVPLEHRKNLQYEIRAFSQQYYKNRFVITCRTQITDYTLPTFTHGEIADLSTRQITQFAQSWFQSVYANPEKEQQLTQNLISLLEMPQYREIKKIAVFPLWLDAICWIFNEFNELPERQFEFYEEGLKIILENQPIDLIPDQENEFNNLSLSDKQQLLSYIAVQTFENRELFFELPTLQHYISRFLSQKLKLKKGELGLASQAILKGIEANPKIIIERAQGVYSFADLALHEYLIGYSLFQELQKILNRPFSRFAKKADYSPFFKATEKMQYSGEFLLHLKHKIDTIVAKDKKIQIFLSWVNQKSILVQVPYKVGAVRAFYFSQSVDRIFEPKLARPLDFSHAVNRTLKSSLHDRSLSCYLDADLDYAFNNNAIRHLAPDFVIDLILECLLVTYAHDLGLFLKFADDTSINITPELKRALERFKEQIPDAEQNRIKYEEWWKANSEMWTRNLRLMIVEHRNIGFDWQFNNEQRDLLKQYYIGNKLLVECLYKTPNISNEVIQEIEETLLLPMMDIKKRRIMGNG